MQINGGATYNINQLWSDDGVLRNADTISNQGNSFMGVAPLSTAVVTSQLVGLLNPASSGIAVFIDQLILHATVNTRVNLAYAAAALGTDLGEWKNLKSGASDGTATLGSGTTITGTYGDLFQLDILADTPFTLTPSNPFMLQEGNTLFANFGTAAKDISAIFIGREFTL